MTRTYEMISVSMWGHAWILPTVYPKFEIETPYRIAEKVNLYFKYYEEGDCCLRLQDNTEIKSWKQLDAFVLHKQKKFSNYTPITVLSKK